MLQEGKKNKEIAVHGGDRRSDQGDKVATLISAGITKRESSQSSQWQKLAAVPAKVLDKAITVVKERDGVLTEAAGKQHQWMLFLIHSRLYLRSLMLSLKQMMVLRRGNVCQKLGCGPCRCSTMVGLGFLTVCASGTGVIAPPERSYLPLRTQSKARIKPSRATGLTMLGSDGVLLMSEA
jgi:hypothetical protein